MLLLTQQCSFLVAEIDHHNTAAVRYEFDHECERNVQKKEQEKNLYLIFDKSFHLIHCLMVIVMMDLKRVEEPALTWNVYATMFQDILSSWTHLLRKIKVCFNTILSSSPSTPGSPKALTSQCRLAVRRHLRKINKIHCIELLDLPNSLINFLQHKPVPVTVL